MEIGSNDCLGWTQEDYYDFYGFNKYCHEKMWETNSVYSVKSELGKQNQILEIH